MWHKNETAGSPELARRSCNWHVNIFDLVFKPRTANSDMHAQVRANRDTYSSSGLGHEAFIWGCLYSHRVNIFLSNNFHNKCLQNLPKQMVTIEPLEGQYPPSLTLVYQLFSHILAIRDKKNITELVSFHHQ